MLNVCKPVQESQLIPENENSLKLAADLISDSTAYKRPPRISKSTTNTEAKRQSL